ncbi:hypothetical protein SANTM175S_09153 [Streptomyces antimycoticus]
MPNQAMATAPRTPAGIFAPLMPNAMRLMTGKGTPVLCPMNPDRVSSRKSSRDASTKAARMPHTFRPSAKRPIANA